MTRVGLFFLTSALLVGTPSSSLFGQTPTALVQQGVRAYTDLDFDAAASFFRQALAALPETSDSTGIEALTYLGATELYRQSIDSAFAVFQRLVLLTPKYRLDELVFPPEVTTLYESVRRVTKAFEVEYRREVQLRIGQGRFPLKVFASSLQDVTVDIVRSDGRMIRALYDGPVRDSLDVNWYGLDTSGNPPRPGSYRIVFRSRDALGTVLRRVQVPFTVSLVEPDTIPHPPPPPDSLFLPERDDSAPGLTALISGLVIGTSVMFLPSAVASDANLSKTRHVVGASISIAGIASYLIRPPGGPVRANINANEALRRQWQREVDQVVEENDRRRADVQIRIRARDPVIIESRR